MEITLDTKIYDLLKEYPFMEDELIRINPKFKKLKNPILRRTLTKIASIKQAAIVGGMEPIELLNAVRKAVGQEPVEEEAPQKERISEETPLWITQEPTAVFSANELLDQGKNPLAEISKKLKSLPQDSVILLRSNFKPEPLIDALKEQGYEIYSIKSGEEYLTFIKI